VIHSQFHDPGNPILIGHPVWLRAASRLTRKIDSKAIPQLKPNKHWLNQHQHFEHLSRIRKGAANKIGARLSIIQFRRRKIMQTGIVSDLRIEFPYIFFGKTCLEGLSKAACLLSE